MHNYNETFIQQIAAETAQFVMLIHLESNASLYVTDCDIPLYYSGHKYSSRAMKVSNISSMAGGIVDRVTIDLDDIDNIIALNILSYDVRDKPVDIVYAALNSNHRIMVAEILFKGFIGEWQIKPKSTALVVMNEFIHWKKRTQRTYSATCPWVFKGVECGYTGDELSCPKKYNKCCDLGMRQNFGGFRFLPAISEKQIWWGRTRSI